MGPMLLARLFGLSEEIYLDAMEILARRCIEICGHELRDGA